MDNTPTLASYLLYLGDTALVTGHRNSEWCGHGPVLEQDIAITNISLDLIGQARNFYQYAGEMLGTDEDKLAYLRDPAGFRNIVMAELPKGDWAFTILRQFFTSTFQHLLYAELVSSPDARLAAIAAKSIKEVLYHKRWSSEWVIRLGDGTDESHRRISEALKELWPYSTEFFRPAPYESGVAPDPSRYRDKWMEETTAVFAEATLDVPAPSGIIFSGKTGIHSDHLDELLHEMQVLPRTYPDATW
ncbi:MAG: phenylacetate-CoA oxygenase subunit PaaI [Chitinophagaceae bacterium]|nr:MAG: phenylacetate-CoA oxygenase subunit PaaI [Chitinophagaceae bacterium]